MSTHRSYTEELQAGLRWAKAFFGVRLTGTIALHADLIAEGVRQAIRARAASVAPIDAYPRIGANTNIERFANDTDATYKDRLGKAFSIWQQAGTKQGLVRALAAFGFPGAIVVEDKDWDRPPKPYWSQFWVVLPLGTHSVTTSTAVYGDGHTYGQTDFLYGVQGITTVQVDGLRRLVRKWKASRSICREFIFESGGVVYGTSHTYGEAGLFYGGTPVFFGG